MLQAKAAHTASISLITKLGRCTGSFRSLTFNRTDTWYCQQACKGWGHGKGLQRQTEEQPSLKSGLKPGFRSSFCLTSSGIGTKTHIYIFKYIIRMQPPEEAFLCNGSDFLQVSLGQRHKPSRRMELELTQDSSCQGEQGERGLWKIAPPSLWTWVTGASKSSKATDCWCHPNLLQEPLSQLKVSHRYQMALS